MTSSETFEAAYLPTLWAVPEPATELNTWGDEDCDLRVAMQMLAQQMENIAFLNDEAAAPAPTPAPMLAPTPAPTPMSMDEAAEWHKKQLQHNAFEEFDSMMQAPPAPTPAPMPTPTPAPTPAPKMKEKPEEPETAPYRA